MTPKVSIIIPTLNCDSVLGSCLTAIIDQRYPQEKLEILIADGGSTDNTLEIAQKYKCRVITNPLKTAEAGKAAGLKAASHSLVAFIDSDNILPDPEWLQTMVLPFSDPEIIGSEPIAFTYRREAGFIERYSALLGSNDPYSFFTGQYDRYSYLSQRWTGLTVTTTDYPDYLKIKLSQGQSIPTIGANGTLFRRHFLLKALDSDYLFDIDIITSHIQKTHTPLYFAKAKTSIIHTFCESSIPKFIRKQTRRLRDFYYFQKIRKYTWSTSPFNFHNIGFALYSVSFILPLIDSIRGYTRLPDHAWFFHPLACIISFYTYTVITIKQILGLNTFYERGVWRQ